MTKLLILFALVRVSLRVDSAPPPSHLLIIGGWTYCSGRHFAIVSKLEPQL